MTTDAAPPIDYMRLNEHQRAVLGHVAEHSVTVVAAGAGSGKTHTMVAGLLDILDRSPTAHVDEFALITFTNRAADELGSRVEGAIADRARRSEGNGRWFEQRERLTSAYIGTIHGFASRVLRTVGFSSYVARSASTTRSRRILGEVLEDLLEETLTGDGEGPFPAVRELNMREHEIRRVLADLLAFCRSRGIALDDVADFTWRMRAQTGRTDVGYDHRVAIARLLQAVDERYTSCKRAEGIVDTEDLLLETARALERDGGVLADRIGRRYRFVFVDEFQDTNPVQKRIIDAFIDRAERAADGGRVLLVGDRKQAIFSFLAATPSLVKAVADERHVELLPLAYSTRPTRQLLKAQNALFASLRDRYGLDEPLKPSGEMNPPELNVSPLRYEAVAAGKEPAAVAAILRELVTAGVPFGAIAILGRTHRNLIELEEGLTNRLDGEVPTRREAGGGLFETPEVLATYHLLSLLLDPDDEVALLEALQTPYLRHLDGSGVLQQVLEAGPDANAALLEWFAETDEARLLDQLREETKYATLTELLGHVIDAFGIQRAYSRAEMDQQAANIERLREHARTITRSDQVLTLRDFVDHLRFAIQLRYNEDEADVDSAAAVNYVRLTTIHAAKGLEYPVVIVPGMQRQLDSNYLDPPYVIDERHQGPVLDIDLRFRGRTGSIRSPAYEERMAITRRDRVAEEMRLLYVAITRAEQAVVLVGAGSGRGVTWAGELERAGITWEAEGEGPAG